VIGVAALAALLNAAGDPVSALILGAIAVTTIPARQSLMPAINAATDAGEQKRFNRLHTLSVGITIAHILLAAWVLWRIVSV
jgi:hypothetical protein